MSRPPKIKIVEKPPLFNIFKPVGVRKRNLDKIVITIDEYEALRLADWEGLDHAEAAIKMEISRSTFTRLIEKAHQKVADFIIHGKQLQIEGGYIHFRRNQLRCRECGNIYPSDVVNLYPCPVCGSTNVENIAKNFGHGRCCHRYGQNK
jgi:predicted DNA-binding protein (UPF0251 family)